MLVCDLELSDFQNAECATSFRSFLREFKLVMDVEARWLHGYCVDCGLRGLGSMSFQGLRYPYSAEREKNRISVSLDKGSEGSGNEIGLGFEP